MSERDQWALMRTARTEACRVRGFLSLGDHARAETALDRALAAADRAERGAPAWAAQPLAVMRAELDAAVSSA